MRALRLVPALLCASAIAQPPFYLRSGDRVVFYGDSITDQRGYTTFIEDYAVTRFPRMELTFIHSGWGGDRVSGGAGGRIDTRLMRDVLAYRPSVVTVMLGMNDGGMHAFQEPAFQSYARGYEHIVDMLQAGLPGVRITAIQPSPYDDVTRAPGFPGGYNATLVRYGDFVRDVAARRGLISADANSASVLALEKAIAADPANALKLIPDRVHPATAGALFIAAAVLKAWNASSLVSAVEIDGAAKKLVWAENTSVSLHEGPGLAWTQLDRALPVPLDLKDPLIPLAVQSCGFLDALDQQLVRIKGLPGSRYGLRIDGAEIARFSREELAAGVNLALLPTPMLAQAVRVNTWTWKHQWVHYTRWRSVHVPLADDGLERLPAALASLDALDLELIQRQHAAAQPVPHHFELVAVP